MEEEVFERINEIAETYEFPVSKVKEYYEKLLTYPFVSDKSEELLFECLEKIISERMSQSFIVKTTELNLYEDKRYRNSEETIDSFLYEVYGEEAIPYISEEVENLYKGKTL